MATIEIIDATHDVGGAIIFTIVTDGEQVTYAYREGDEYAGETAKELAKWLESNAGSVKPYVPDDRPVKYIIAKTTPWNRMTDDEAEIMDAVMTSAPARLRNMYNAAQYLDSSDPFFETIRIMLAEALPGGLDRANELLAKES